jgi:hypothetical protein
MTPKQFLDKKHPNFLNSCFHQADYFTVKKMLKQYKVILDKEFDKKYNLKKQ